MIDLENYIFNYISTALLLVYPKLKVRNEYVAMQSAFPLCTIEELENTVVEASRTDKIENAVSVTYEINVYAETKAEAKGIMAKADEKITELGFTRVMCNRTPNTLDNTLYRITARYDAVIDKEETTTQSGTTEDYFIYQGA